MQEYELTDERLPEGQEPIRTSNVARFEGFIKLIVDPHTLSPTMGAVTGAAGVGKTVSIQAYVSSMPPRSHTDLPAAIMIEVKPKSTPKAIAIDIVKALQDRPRGSTIFEVADEAAAAIVRNDLKLLFIDEADRLNEDSFEVVRHLYDSTRCPIVVVGLPRILGVIDAQEKFASRVGLRMGFRPLNVDEVLSTFLPQLVIPGWEFDRCMDDDREMGIFIWDMVRPSLRKLRNLLERASTLARGTGSSQITVEIIEDALQWTATSADKKQMDKTRRLLNQEQRILTFEEESELRQEAKKKRLKNK